MEVLPAVLVSVLTTLVAFLPILFIQGNLEMMYEMAVVVIVCLMFSLLESMFMLPAHCASAKVLAPPSATSFSRAYPQRIRPGNAARCANGSICLSFAGLSDTGRSCCRRSPPVFC